MRIDPIIRSAMEKLPCAYDIVKTKDHYLLKVSGYPAILIGDNHQRSHYRHVKRVVSALRRLSEAVEKKQ